jgi:biotin synthase
MRSDWTRGEIAELFDLPFLDLVARAHGVHLGFHPGNEVQLSTLLSIKTGGCAEDCGYCSQSASANSGLKAEKLNGADAVVEAAREAKTAAWRSSKERDMPTLIGMVGRVKALGLETCMRPGMLGGDQAACLADAGLDYYNHNIDPSPENYGNVITTRTFQDRLDTLELVCEVGMNVCCGGILGMGETRADRVGFLHSLAALAEHPQSVLLNVLVPIEGTVLGDILRHGPSAKIDDIEFVRTVAVARIIMPQSMVRLSTGRESMSDSMQALCFMAGANSIFTGDRLLTTGNAGNDKDVALFEKLGTVSMGDRHPVRMQREDIIMGIA